MTAERETVIVANLADLDEGWFSVETTEKGVFSRLKRICGDKLQVIEHRSSLNGKITTWKCRVRAEFWRGNLLKVAKPRTSSPKQLAVLQKARKQSQAEKERGCMSG